MAGIQSLGVGSGLLTTELVEDIVSAERAASDLRLDAETAEVEAKITAYGEIKSRISSFETSVSALTLASNLNSTSATASNTSVLSATTTSAAEEGSYSIQVNSLAQSHSLATGRYTSVSDAIGTGTLTFRFGEITYDGSDEFDTFAQGDSATSTVTITDGTLSGIRDAINDASIGVTASVVDDGVGFRLLLTTESGGSDNAMSITASSGLGALNYNETDHDSSSNLEELQQGTDAAFTINGLSVVSDSNEVSGVIGGVTLNLTETSASATTLTVSRDTSLIAEKLQDFVDSYNEVKSYTDELVGYNEDTGTAGLLLGDSTLRTISDQVRRMMSTVVEGLESGSLRSMPDIGVYTDSTNSFLLTFDQAKFNEAMSTAPEELMGLLATEGTTSDSQITYLGDSVNTQAGSYAIEITQMATQGVYNGLSVDALDFASAVVIDDNNDEFTINVNDEAASITLTQGSYTSGDDLAQEIQSQINGADDISDNGLSVVVSYESSTNSFNITSSTYGSNSNVYFSSLDSNTANSLGFSTLGVGEFTGTELVVLGADNIAGQGAQTKHFPQDIDESTGIDFSLNNSTFTITVAGTNSASAAVTVDLDASGNDLNGDGNYGDRDDTLQAIQTAIDATALSGFVTAAFDDNDYLYFETTAKGTGESIQVTGVGSSTTDVLLGLEDETSANTNGVNTGIDIDAGTTFKVEIDGTLSSDITITAGNYSTGANLATEIENQINADANLTAAAVGAVSVEGLRDIASSVIDFSTDPAGFTLNVNGTDHDILINSGTGLAAIQSALDTEFGASVLTASVGSNDGLVITTAATGPSESLAFTSSGRGAQSDAGDEVLVGYDFSSSNATFDITVDGVVLNITVDGDGTSGSNDAESTLSVIQAAIDDSLVASGQFSAGDVIAQLDGSNQVYFESVAKEGVQTANLFGADASIEISNVGGGSIAETVLGLDNAVGVFTNGFDGFGHSTDKTYGNHAEVSVTFNANSEDGTGYFEISVANTNAIEFSDISTKAAVMLGIHEPDGSESDPVNGVDVEGTINGIAAEGTGQLLVAQDGNDAATPGYLLGISTIDFSSPVVIDSGAADPNNEFTININGTEETITLADATYVTGTSLATALENAINDHATFEDSGDSVTVSYSEDSSSYAYQRFSMISNKSGANSVVEITSMSTGVSNTFGFAIGNGDGEDGQDMDGDVDGSSGLRLRVTGGDIGSRGSITYFSGIADQLKSTLESMLDSTGAITVKEEALQEELTSIEEEKTDFDARMDALDERLRAQFAYNDALISTLNSTLDYLQTQFDVMNNSGDS